MLYASLQEDRVLISGKAVLFSVCEFQLGTERREGQGQRRVKAGRPNKLPNKGSNKILSTEGSL